MNNKSIGLSQGIALYIAAILGSGVPFLSGVTASMAGPASNLSWLIVIIISFPLAYTFASQAKKYPDVGGQQLLLEIHSDIILGISLGGFTL